MRKLLFAAALVVIAVAALVIPLPVAVVTAGPVLEVAERVQIASTDADDDLTGRFLLTTVALDDASAVETIAAMVDDDRDVIARQQLIPPGLDEEEYLETQRRLFEESARVAVVVGSRAAGLDVDVSGAGARVLAVVPGGPADGELREGDVIVGIDGEPVELAADLVSATSRRAAGDTVELTVERGDDQRNFDIELGRVDQLDRPALGVVIRTLELDLDLPRELEIDSGGIGGPSAGLMIALTTLDLLDERDLAAGRVIAGTGTIDLDGRVGLVGGVDHKADAARGAGAELFFVPEQEADAARDAVGDEVTVVPVSTFEDAVEALTGGAAGG